MVTGGIKFESNFVEAPRSYKGIKPPSELKLVEARSLAGTGVAALATSVFTCARSRVNASGPGSHPTNKLNGQNNFVVQ